MPADTRRYDWAVQKCDHTGWSTHQDHTGRDHETALTAQQLAETIATRLAPCGPTYRAAVWPAGHEWGDEPIAIAACAAVSQRAAA